MAEVWSEKHQQIVDALVALTRDERYEVIHEAFTRFCKFCFDDNCGGSCNNDE